MNIEEMQGKSVTELVTLLEEFTREQINLRLQKSVGQLTAPHRLQIVRRNIARVKTLLRQESLSTISTLNKNTGEAA